eukprot:UN33369
MEILVLLLIVCGCLLVLFLFFLFIVIQAYIQLGPGNTYQNNAYMSACCWFRFKTWISDLTKFTYIPLPHTPTNSLVKNSKNRKVEPFLPGN